LAPTSEDEELVYFNIKIDFFAGMGGEPKANEIEAMICQTNKFFQAAMRNMTKDPDLQSYATNIDWLYDASQPLSVVIYFTSHTTFGDGSVVPAEDVYNYILKQADAKLLVTDYIWQSEPYPDNVFYQTEDILLGASYSGAKTGRDIAPGRLEKATCPT
jgi:hypothetical protein